MSKKNTLKTWLSMPMTIVLIFICAFFGLPALGKNAEIDEYAIATAIGLDTAEDGVEVSFLIFVPVADQTFAESYKVVSATGESISKATHSAGLEFGREIGLSHVKLVVVGEDFFSQDTSLTLDYLARDKTLSLGTSLVSTNVSAFEFLCEMQKLDSESAIKSDELIDFNNTYVFAQESTLESFYRGLYEPTRTSLVSYIMLETDTEDGVSVMIDAQGGSSQGEQGAQSEEKKIVNDGSAILCKDGKEVALLSSDDMQKLYLSQGGYSLGSLVIDNFTDDVFTNAKLTFEITGSKVVRHASFKSGTPIVYIDLKLYVHLTEAQENDALLMLNADYNDLSTLCVDALRKEVDSETREGLEIMRAYGCDVLDVYTLLNNTNPVAFKRFYENLGDKDDFLKSVIFKFNPQIFSN